MVTDYRAVTEQWGTPMSASQIEMAHTRYGLAANHAGGKAVLEIGCGSGFGMQYLARFAVSVVGCDITHSNVKSARRRTGLPVVHCDAQRLPFVAGSFQLAVLLEGIYYLPGQRLAYREAYRVLKRGATLLVCLPNREASGFHPSPHSHGYPSAGELAVGLREAGFDPEIYGGFRVGQGGAPEKAFLLAAKIAKRFHMIPRTLKGRARVKRLLQGRLEPFRGLEPGRAVAPLTRLPTDAPVRDFKILYAVATRREG